MKRFHQLFLFAQILLIASIVVTTLAPVQAEVVEDKKEEEGCEHDKGISKDLKVHLDYYYELLADKYAPDQIGKWKDIRVERDLLQKKLKEAKQRGELENGQAVDKTWLDKHSELQSVFNAAVEKRDEEQLKIVLPQLFDHYAELNKLYKKRLNLNTIS
ncbi:hypothetical protein [Halalkalibacter akibai]|uniref:Uncharacterized protein n=1 Tax=Halalkalibacter akibai (strain ATCC 43226 / DSM 21942 / CIP 109018 / JCM 9157 / 1139) TaxID=1236973 RepID=W4QX11_HALA3|nr:hypothetical protein [Halalkalibacter akibai]GAE36636.1 hypothetical protein JCM9157_3837 [Halalkalibacter akibai JCM 9157]